MVKTLFLLVRDFAVVGSFRNSQSFGDGTVTISETEKASL